MRLLDIDGLRNKGITFSRQHLYRLIKANKFPAPVKIGENRNGWVEAEIDQFLRARAVERGDNQWSSAKEDRADTESDDGVYHSAVTDLARDLGGVGTLSTIEIGLVRQAAAITLRSEQMLLEIASGKAVDPEQLIRLSSELRRLYREVIAIRKSRGELEVTTPRT